MLNKLSRLARYFAIEAVGRNSAGKRLFGQKPSDSGLEYWWDQPEYALIQIATGARQGLQK